MGIREYFKNSGNDIRWKLSAGFAVMFHMVVLLGGSLVMAQKAEYGMAGSVAGGGNPRAVPTPVEMTVELDASDDDAPAEHRKNQKPAPTLVIPTGIGGRVSGAVVEVPAYYRNPPPVYSLEARARKEEGVVMLHAEVDTQGKVTSVSLVQSSGFEDLDESALDAVKNWQFKPAQIAGIPVSSSAKIPIRFRLKDFR